MTNEKTKPQSEKTSFDYTFDKLNKAVDKCDNSTLEWVVASTRTNEIDFCKREITESIYKYRQKSVIDLIANFSYNCRCSQKTQTMMLSTTVP